MRSDLSDLPRWVRWLFLSWPLGRLAGVQIRIHVLTLLVPLVASGAFGGPTLWACGWGLASTGLLYVVILTHEFGHITAGRRFRIRTSEIVLSPLGGVAHMQAAPPSPRAEILIALAGPIVHLLWLLPIGALHLTALGEGLPSTARIATAILWHLNLWLLAFNILPFFPMDGGRALRGLIALRWHANLATLRAAQIGLLGGFGLMLYGLGRGGFGGSILLFIGLNNLLICWREMRTARYAASPYGEPRQPWEEDPEAWKVGQPSSPARTRRAERRKQRDEAEREIRARREAQDQEELDRLLARVAEVGLSGLSAGERRALDSASRRLRLSRTRDR
jgi:Zn-dependent protease